MIVVFGLKPERLVGAEGRIDAVPEPPTTEQAGLLVDALSSGIKAGGSVIAIVPEWFAPDGLQRLEMARALLDTDARRDPCDPAAAAGRHRARQRWRRASARGCRPPGLLGSALPGLEEQLHHDHLARQRHRAQAPRAEPRPARRLA